MIDVTAAASLTPPQLEALFANSSEGAPDDKQDETHPSAGLSLRKVVTEPGEPLRLEIESFLNSVRLRETPRVSGAAAREALSLALAIQESIREHRQRSGL